MAAPPFMLPGNVVHRRYRLVRQIGEGGMGTVFEVEDLELRRMCALKVLQAQLLHEATAYQRFMREAEFAAGLDHEHVVRVFDRGELEHGVPFYTMELLRGRSLADTAELEHRLPWKRARHIAVQLCRVLMLVHARGIVHRDLKPDNCFLVTLGGDRDFLKLLDFGLARADTNDPRLTADSQVLGTAMYMSPQQARGEVVDHRADVYAVGVILFQLLAGYPPFERVNALQVLEAIKNEEAPPPSYFNPQLPPEVDALVARAMHKTLERRYQSAEALLEAIEEIAVDAVVACAPAEGSRAPPPRIHTPTAMALTQAAGEARAHSVRHAAPAVPAVVTPLLVPVMMPSISSVPTVVAPPPEQVGAAPARRRMLVAVLAGLAVAAAVVAVVMTRESGPAEVVEPPKPVVEPPPLEPPKPEPPEPPEPEREPPDPPVSDVNLKPSKPGPSKPKLLSQAEVERLVTSWQADAKRSPSAACGRIVFRQELKFTAMVVAGKLELTGEDRAQVSSCAKELRGSFRARFAGKAVQAGVRVPVALVFERKDVK